MAGTVKKKTSSELFTARELRTYLNNAVVAALRPATLGLEIPRKRLYRLSAYVRAFCEDTFEHVEEGLLRPEELVLIFLAAALYVQDSIKEVGTAAEAHELTGVSQIARGVMESLKLSVSKEAGNA